MKSMTGFGRVRTVLDGNTIEILISSLNHRFIEIFTSLPEGFDILEVPIRKIVREKLKRGKIMVKLSISRDEHLQDKDVKEFLRALEIFNKKTRSDVKPNFSDFLLFVKEKCEKEKFLKDTERKKIEKILIKVIKKVDEMRKREGEKTKREMKKSIGIIDKAIRKIEKLKRVIEKSMMKEISNLPEKEKLLQEKDFSEELSRFQAHLSVLKSVVERDEAGKKILFIEQEMLREITTLTNKAGNFKISLLSIEIKNELEKLREHAQNIL
jgi:uncharacterized protein (TIGR00255 family)